MHMTPDCKMSFHAQDVAAFTASCEKYVGTESGGMDQAISIMGEKGRAKLVHFKPVRPALSSSILSFVSLYQCTTQSQPTSEVILQCGTCFQCLHC
jgi:galactokinase